MKRFEILAERRNYGRHVDLIVFSPPRGRWSDLGDKPPSVAQPLTFVPYDMDAIEPVPPTLTMPMDDAQGLIDELWRCGLRPTEGTGSAGSLAATERHLKDMQAVAMALLKKDGAPL